MEESSTGAVVPAVKREEVKPLQSAAAEGGGAVAASETAEVVVGPGPTAIDDKDMLCPICMEIIKDAFLTACGHSFCYMCIVTHLNNKSDCPCCGLHLTSNQLFPNFLLDKLLKKTSVRQVSKNASPAEQFHQSLQQGCEVSVKELDTLLTLLAEKKRKLEQEEAERNMQILMNFLHCLRKQKVDELNEIQTDLQFIKEDINAVERHRIDLYRARDRYSVKLRMLGDDPTLTKSWPSPILKNNNSGHSSSSRNFQGGMGFGNFQSKKADGKAQVSTPAPQRKESISRLGSENMSQSGLAVVRKKRVHAQFNDLQECYLQKRRQLANQPHKQEERETNVIHREGYTAVEFRSACLVVLESRRFDKVKVVRDTMNRTMEIWRKVPGDPERVLSRSQSKSFSKDDVGARCSPTLSRSSSDDTFETPKLKKTPPTSRPPSSDNSTATIGLKRSPSKSVDKKPSITMMGKLDVQKKSDWSIEIAVLQPSSLQVASNVDSKDGNIEVVDSITNESSRSVKSETKRVLFSETYHEKLHKFGGLRSGSRVVPYSEIDDCESDVVESNAIEDVDGNQKDVEGLNMIRKQLVQIENQQSNLFDLLQRLIGSSQSGMNFLETRVNGLEKALDEISYDLGLSTGKISNTDSGGNACCMLPAADFVSPKFWKRTEGHYSSRFSLPGRNRSLTAMHSMPNKDANVEISNLGNPIDQCQSWDRFVASPVADTHRNLRGGMQSCSSKNLKKISQDADKLLVCGGGGVEGTFTPSCIAAANMCRRSCA